MKVRILICVITACLIGGCASSSRGFLPALKAQTITCDRSTSSPRASCDVPVDVRCFLGIWPCFIDSYEQITVKGSDSSVISWSLVSADYVFADKGIEFEDTRVFSCSKKGETGTEFQCSDSGKKQKDPYKYTIRLAPKGRAFGVGDLDPWVVNE